MGLYERILGLDPETWGPKVQVQFFSAAMAEFARGRVTAAEANAIIAYASGAPLNAGEQAEAQTLVGTISGSSTVKVARAKEIEDVLNLADARCPKYDTAALVKARLGV